MCPNLAFQIAESQLVLIIRAKNSQFIPSTMNQKRQYLEERLDTWRKQLHIKGRKLKAFDVWSHMIVNSESPQDAANVWSLPIEALVEAIKYCETHQELIEKEAIEEKQYLKSKGYTIEPLIIN